MNIGLWKSISEKGTEYYRGVKTGIEINGVKYRVSVFINEKKKSDKSPDMNIVLTEIKEKEAEVVNEFSTLDTKTDYKQDGDIQLEDKDLPF